jgi:hypothetical protein
MPTFTTFLWHTALGEGQLVTRYITRILYSEFLFCLLLTKQGKWCFPSYASIFCLIVMQAHLVVLLSGKRSCD